MTLQPGDIFLTHGSGFVSRTIQFGESLYRPRGRSEALQKRAAGMNHTGIITSRSGGTIEALGRGVVRGNLIHYKPNEIRVIDTRLTPEQRELMIAYAESKLGDPYGWLQIASIAGDILSGTRFSLRWGDSVICSELVAQALEHTGWICPKGNTALTYPSDIDAWLGD